MDLIPYNVISITTSKDLRHQRYYEKRRPYRFLEKNTNPIIKFLETLKLSFPSVSNIDPINLNDDISNFIMTLRSG